MKSQQKASQPGSKKSVNQKLPRIQLIAGEDEMDKNLKRMKELQAKINEAVPAY